MSVVRGGGLGQTFGPHGPAPMGGGVGEGPWTRDRGDARGKGTRRQTTRLLALGLLAVMAGVAAPLDSYGVGVGRGQRVHFTIGETRGGVPGREGKAPGNQHLRPQQGEVGTTTRRVECAACVAAEDRASSASRAAQKQQTSRAHHQPGAQKQQTSSSTFQCSARESRAGP